MENKVEGRDEGKMEGSKRVRGGRVEGKVSKDDSIDSRATSIFTRVIHSLSFFTVILEDWMEVAVLA